MRVESPEQMLMEGPLTPFPKPLCEKAERDCLTPRGVNRTAVFGGSSVLRVAGPKSGRVLHLCFHFMQGCL